MRLHQLAFGALLFYPTCFSGNVAERPPNFVLIISDDPGWTDYGFMGHPVIPTPNLDRLDSESMVYTRGYVPTPLCRPSLTTLATGLYPHQHQITGNHPPGERQAIALDVDGNAGLTRIANTLHSKGSPPSGLRCPTALGRGPRLESGEPRQYLVADENRHNEQH
ncbi:MAG: sulfatase-like hydrolase/transferase [Bryobacterales bacterium]|nr:sulfatase-like hydrolase/transferase [Bryobacterales bacterium]